MVVIMGTVFDIFEESSFATMETLTKCTLWASMVALGMVMVFFMFMD